MIASLPSGWREQADRVGERLHIDPVDWYRAADTPKFLREVAAAVWEARRIGVRYESWRGVARRELEPLGLVLKAGAWYLLARASGQAAVRTYRLASLLELKTRPGSFRRPRAFQLARAWQESSARFEAELHRLRATVLISPRAATWLANERIPTAPASALVPVARAGWRAVDIAIESIEQGARQLASFAAEAEVLAPAELRAELIRLARAVLSLHRARR
jgi:predicted DNA-binding transcriptional regulator YafY